jgi:cytochrome P450
MADLTPWQQALLYENRANPYPFYAELRKTPVSRQPNGTYVVSTYREIVSILHDPRVSSDLRKRPNAPSVAAEAPSRLRKKSVGAVFGAVRAPQRCGNPLI